MRKLTVFAFLVSAAVLAPLAQAPPAMAAQARQAYEQGRYAEASKLYALMAQTGYDGAEVQFDLGNSFLKGGDVARAIVAYRRALQFDSKMEPAASNLATARRLLPAKAVAWQPPPWEAAITSVGANVFSLLTLLLAFAGNLFLWIILFLGPGGTRRTLAAIMTGLFIAAAISGGCLYYAVRVAPMHQPVVVVSPARVTEKAANEGAELATLPPGSEVVRVASAGDWSLLMWGEGRGWTESANLEAP